MLDAGRRLLGEADLARLSVNAVVSEAGMAKGSFYQHWPSRREYVRALHVAFHDRLTATMLAAAGERPHGLERLSVVMHAYLDGCLAESSTKALLVQSRTEAGLADLVAERNAQAAALAAEDLRAIGWRPPDPVAALLVAVVAEIALQELSAGRRRDDLREAALRMARGHLS